MRVAITTDGRSVSKQFLTTKGIEIFEVQQGKANNKMLVDTSVGGNYKDLSYILQNEGVDVLLCGEINSHEKQDLEACGIEVFSGAKGSTSSIFNAYLRSLRQSGGGNGRNR